MRKGICRVLFFSFIVFSHFFTSCLSKDDPTILSDYSVTCEYSSMICPGDPVYLAITLHGYEDQNLPHDAQLTLYKLKSEELAATDETQFAGAASETQVAGAAGEAQAACGIEPAVLREKIKSTDMYYVRQNPPVYFAILPTSTWAEPGDYLLEVDYRNDEEEPDTLMLPVTMAEKEFISETLYLDAKNTAIKTDNSKQRAAQIDRLNDILFTTDQTAIFYDGSFMEPCESRRYTSFFGDRRVYQYSNGKKSTSLHYGTDYGVPVGTPVWACGSGKVVLAEYRNSTGWSVVIEHLPGLYSLYYHMDTLSVDLGQMVRKGQEIGKSGCTGLATGPHLHWEVRLFGEAINPQFFVDNLLF